MRGGEREGEGKAGWGIGQTPRHFLASWLAGDGPAPPSRWPGTQQPGSRLLLSFLLWRAPLLTRGEIGMREQDDRSRKRQPPGPDPRAAAPPQPVRALRETPHAPRGSSAARGSSPAAASPPGLRHPLAFSVTQVRKTESLPRAGLQGERQSRDPGGGGRVRGNPQTPALASPPRHRSGRTPPWRRLGIVFWRGPQSQRCPHGKSLSWLGYRPLRVLVP